MNKVEIMGIISACVFAALGFLESGMVAACGVIVSGIVCGLVFISGEESKRKSFQRTKKALLRARLRKTYI